MPKKKPQTDTPQIDGQLLNQLLNGNATAEQVESALASLADSWPPAAIFDGAFGPDPIELPDPPASLQTFTIRVDLRHAKPPIWRLLKVPGDTTLGELHDVLQAAMGWDDSHLHRFELHTGGNRRGAGFSTDADREDEGPHEGDVRLDQVVTQVGDKLHYEYDFGDSWSHVLVVKAVERATDRRLRCIGGRRACPPDDCGGIWAYQEIVEALALPASRRDEWAAERLEMLFPAGFDPKHFDAEEIDDLLQGGQGGQGGQPGDEWEQELDELPVPRSLLPLVGMCPVVPDEMGDLMEIAGLTDDAPQPPSAEVAARLVRPWVVLLREIGTGLALTEAGHLPPESVARIAGELGLEIGHGDREDRNPPVAELRSTAQALGLIRARKGTLTPTAAGKLAGDPDALIDTPDTQALLRHIESRLPLHSSPFEQHASLLLLLVVAAGARPSDGLGPIADTLSELGWRADDHSVTPLVVRHEADLTYAVLDQLHLAAGGDAADDPPTTPDTVRDVARRVLHGDGAPTIARAPMAGRELREPRPTLVVVPPEAGDPAQLADIDPQQMVATATDSLLEGIAEARHALEAELTLSSVFAIVDQTAPDDIDEQDLRDTMAFMLGEVIGYAESLGSEDALALLRVASVVGPEATRGAARAGAERLAASGVPDRPWADRVGRPELLRAWRYGDIFGQQESVGLALDYRGREHAVMVLIDHQLGGGVKDCWVAEGKQIKRLYKDIGRLRAGDSDTFFEDIDAQKAAEVLGAALEQPPCPFDPDQVEDVALHLPLLQARTGHLRELAASRP